jgi:ferredoxin-NADP reductase
MMMSIANVPQKLSMLRFHPYSISSAPGGEEGNFNIIIKGMGKNTWSQLVCALAATNPDLSSVKVRLGGPHGRLQFRVEDYQHFLFFSGGVGATPMASVFFDVYKRWDAGELNVSKATFVWSTRSNDDFKWFADEMAAVQRNPKAAGIFSFKLFNTSTKVHDLEVACSTPQQP